MVPRTWSSHAPSGAVAERVDEGYVEHGPRGPIATPGESLNCDGAGRDGGITGSQKKSGVDLGGKDD